MKKISQANSSPYEPVRKHYGFAIFENAEVIYSYLSKAQTLKAAEPHCFITWFISEENKALVHTISYIDQLVVLEGSPTSLISEISRLQIQRSWAKFFTIEPNLGNEAQKQVGKKVLLGHLVSNGDCLYATTLARQIKEDYQGCHLTWGISSMCRSVIEENPFVDEIWEINVGKREDWAGSWYKFVQEAKKRQAEGEFDEIFLTQIYPDFEYYDSTIRPSIFRAYPNPITVPVQNILKLRENEVEKVKKFAEFYKLQECKHVILFECTPSSGQSMVTPQYAVNVSKQLLEILPDSKLILSTHIKIATGDERIIDGSVISLRENAELTKYCSLFVGCSSGVTQIALTDWAKPLPIIQILAGATSVYASVAHDFEYWGNSTEQFIEMTDTPAETLVECIRIALTKSFAEARKQFHQKIPIDFKAYLNYIRNFMMQFGKYGKVAQSVLYTTQRYGWHQQLKTFVEKEVIPQLGLHKNIPASENKLAEILALVVENYKNNKEQLFLNSPEFVSQLSQQIEDYNNRDASDLLNSIRQVRQQIAELWLEVPDEQLFINYANNLGEAHQIILNSSLKLEPLTESEQTFISKLTKKLAKNFENSGGIQYLLAAMLYQCADQLPVPVDLSRIPQWFVNAYIKYVLQFPQYFTKAGEIEHYNSYLQQWVEYLHQAILSEHNSFVWMEVASEFVQNANFIWLYFNPANLKDIYVKRAELIEYVLTNTGHQLDWEFPTRTLAKKIRLGILAAPLIPSTETFVSLPVYEYISREFEVILYSFTQTDHSLERYCQSCANSFKILPINLKEAVNLIRNDELDILYIAADITTVINPICLLATHRLARVQITNIASSFPTGLQQIDYYIAGEFRENYQTEEHQKNLIKINNFSPCVSYGDLAEPASFSVNKQSLGISENSIVFVSAANFFSLTPEVVETWAKILANVNNSVLLILPFTQKPIANYIKNAFSKSLKNQFTRNQISSNRLIILDPPNPNREDIKNCLKLGKIYLDTMFFSESQGIIEALEIGLPVITKQGNFRDSIASSLLQALEVTQLIADSEETYIEKAVNMANNANLLQNSSEEIKQKMQTNPLFLDSRFYAAKLELMFKNIIQQYDIDQLTHAFKLRDINLVLFPDWNQSEEFLFQDLSNVLRGAINHPQKHQITLLIDTTNIAEETADLTISSIVMELLMSEDLDIEDGPEISLFGNLSKMQWQMLLPKIHARIILENENQQTLAEVQTHKILTAYTSDSLSQTERL